MNIIKRQQRPFQDRVKVGEYGEKVVMQYFKDRKIHFLDLRNDSIFQKDEIDFLSYMDGNFYSIETKTSEKNIFEHNSIMVKLHTKYKDIEECKKRGNDAYLYRTTSDYLFYVCCKTNDIIIVKTKTIKDYINANKHNLFIKVYDDEEKNNSKYNRINVVTYIPLNKIKAKRIKTNYKFNLDDYNFSSKRQ